MTATKKNRRLDNDFRRGLLGQPCHVTAPARVRAWGRGNRRFEAIGTEQARRGILANAFRSVLPAFTIAP